MAEEFTRAFDLTKVDDSDIMTQPFSLSETDPIVSQNKSNVMTGEEFSKLGKVSSSWNDPEWKKTSASEVFGTEKVDLTKPEEFVASTSQGFIDEIANFPDKAKNTIAQIVMEGYQDKNKLAQRLVGYLSKITPQLPIGVNTEDVVKKVVEKSDVFKPKYDEKLVNTLDGREYPLVEWAKKTLATTTKAIQDRDLARAIQAEQRGIDREAWSNEIGRTIGAMVPVIALGKGVGATAKALGASAEAATTIGGAAMKAGTMAQMAADYGYTTAAQYVEKTGDKDFTNFTPEDAKGLSALGYGAIGTMIEYGFGGVEPLFANGMEKLGTSNILKAVGKTMVGEAWEEFLQEWEEFLFRTADGTNTRTWGETLKDSLKSAVYGGLIGGAIGDVAYRTNRRNIANALMQTGMDYNTAVKIADTVIEDTGAEIFKRADENVSLMNQVGESYNKLKAGVRTALETVGWSETMLDPTTQQPMDIDSYSDVMARNISSQVIRQASVSGLSPNEFMDLSSFQVIDNVVYLKPLGNVKAQLDEQNAIIKRQLELKKTGASDNNKLSNARMRKNILQKAYNIQEYKKKQAKEQIKRQTTPELAKEIETATKDAEVVKELPTQADFGSKVESENLTSAEKSKRYGNAVLKRLLPSKSDFDAVMVDPMYANAKQAIIAVADRINSFIKAHRTYSLKTDIANALKKMQTVNQGNFIDSVTTPDLDGVDVIAENAFLYHFLFSDATTIQTYLDSYITRAEDSLNQKKGNLSKKDLVGQSFKATDNAMQTQAQVIGAEYTSIYNEDGSYADKNVMAVMLSYQNQFVQEQGQQIPPQMLEQFDLADENSRLDDIYPAYDGETIEVDGKERTVYNSEGKRIAKSKEALTNFWRWFGDSKAIDEEGQPLVLYHGTDEEFDTFAKSDVVDAFFFTDKRKVARRFTTKEDVYEFIPGTKIAIGVTNKGVMPVYLKMEDVAEYDGEMIGAGEGRDWRIAADKSSGKDGVIITDADTGAGTANEYIVFEPTQIKSVDNRGTYSDKTGNIYFQAAYAGSRVDYDQPSLEAIGSGEGNQAHGWGLYYALNKDIANKYYKMFEKQSKKHFNYNGSPIYLYLENQIGANFMREETIMAINKAAQVSSNTNIKDNLVTNLGKVEKKLKKTNTFDLAEKEKINKAINVIKDMEQDNFNLVMPQVHEVDIPEMDVLLDEQKKFSEQPEFVKEQLAKIGSKYLFDMTGLSESEKIAETSRIMSDWDGGGIYKRLSSEVKGDKKASQLLEKYGIKGITYDGRQDGRCFVIFNPDDVQVLRRKFDEYGNILFQADKITDKNLVVTHGISVDKLEKVLKLGGLPVPSIAISKIDEPLENFGAIKLVGTKEIINPELRSSNLVYDRDIWSKRLPRPEYKNAKLADVRKFRDKFEKYFVRADNTSVLYGSITDPLVNSRYPAQAIEAFQNSDGAKLYYIENILGDRIDVPKYDRAKRILDNLTLFVEADEQFIKEISEIDVNIDNVDKLRKEVEKPIRDLINRYDFTKKYGKYADKIKQESENHYFSEKFKGSDITYMIRSAKEYLRMLKDDSIRYGVDNMALNSVLEKYKLYDNQDYMDWSEKQITDLLGEPRVKVGNKLLPWTVENITSAMIKGRTIGTESDSISIGKIIASGAKRFSNLESIREEGKRLQTQKQSEEQTDQLGNDMYMLAEDIINAAELSDNYSNVDMVLLSLQEGVSKKSITEDGFEKLLNKNLDIFAKYPRDLLKRGVDLIKQTKDIVRFYFEAKPQRVVSLNEFAGAVVPTDERYNEISAKLSDRGLYVVRTDNLQDGILNIENLSGNVLFQSKKANGFYDPELGVIVLGRNMNTMTLPHEMQHYWLDKIFSIYKRAKAGELKVRDEWMTETKDLFGMLGIDENQTQLTEGQQEKFARMSEAYLTGMGVSGDMNATFKEYQHWIPEKYKSMMNLAYKDDDGKIVLPYLDQAAVDFFNKWYANYSLPSLATSPERQEFINPEDENGEVLPVSIKEMNNRDKEFGVDAEEQVKTDQRLYNTLDENMPAEIKIESDGQKVVQESRSNFLKESEKQQRRWFERKSRDTEAQLAQDYIEKNPEHAKEVVYGDPELVPNDTGIDRATLINAYMALNKITPESEDWATLQTNIAINQSLAGTQLALSNNTSYRTYLDALREIEDAREMKVATNYAGAKQGAVERFNRDIQRFVDQELPKVLATAPNSQAREIALKSLFEMARTKFSGNTTGSFLNQMDLDFAKAQKGVSAAFTRWAINQIKKDAGAKLNNQEQAKLLEISAKAQQAVTDLDDRNIGKAVAGAVAIREWQVEKDKLSGVSPEKFSLFGDWAPRAMLASFNTLVVSNIPSTAMNTLVVRMLESGVFGENNVSKSLTDSEIKRIKAIYGASAMNLAQMEKPTSPSLLHGEKYSSSGQKWYDPFTILGKEDNWFRVPTFVNTLARIATQDAKTTGRDADEVFKEYCRLENQSDEAKLARKQALAVSNMAVFTQDGGLARALNGIRDWLNKGSRTLIGLDPKGFGLGNLLSPFLKTGANIAEMGIRGSIAPITTISALAQSWRSGKAIDPMKKLALKMDWSYFALSSLAVALLSALTSDDDEFYTDPYETGKAYDPNKPYDSINIAGVWIDLDFFGVFAIPIRTGCKLVKQWKTDNLSAIYKGYGQGLKYAAMDTPLLQEIFNNQISYASKKTEDWATGLAYNQVNKFVPSQIKPLSRAISRGTGTELDISGAGKVLERKFHRNYGFDGAELTTQDLIDIFTTKITYQE